MKDLVLPTTRDVAPPLWERQLGESRKAFDAFRRYRDMGPTRSLTRVGQELGKSRALMARWSSRWRWVERAESWDDQQDRVAQIELQRQNTDLTRARIEGATVLIERGVRELQSTERPLQPFEVARLIEVASRLGDVAGRKAERSAPVFSIEQAVFANAARESDPRLATD